MGNKTNTPSYRIDIADVLRGLAVAGIVLLHSIEHFNFYVFPETDMAWLQFANEATWDSLFFALAGKAYAVFALLFGFSYYIQDSNAEKRGIDFRMRFLWRLFLLFLFGQLNAAFFTAEVLVLYALLGFVLPLFARSSTKTVLVVAIVLMLQPMEWGRLLYALCNPDFVAPDSLDRPFWKAVGMMQREGDFWGTVKANLWDGQLASLGWAVENARCFQTPALFLLGMLVGRLRLFYDTPQNKRLWFGLFMSALILFFPMNGLAPMLKEYVQNPAVLKPALLITTSLAKFFFMTVLVSGTILVYYTFPSIQKILSKIIPYGKMSLTNYITQSIVGSFLFYNWGLKLSLGAFHSALLGVAMLIAQYALCCWWMKHHQHGPLEYLWKKATWIKLK